MQRSTLCLILLTLSALSGEPESYEAALKLAKKSGKELVVLVHGSDWNRPGERFRRTVWNNPKFASALDNEFVRFSVDVLENPSEEQKKTLAARHKGFKTKFGNYPVLAVHDPEGRRTKLFTGDTFPYAPRATLDELREARELRLTRDRLLAEAAKASADRRPSLLFLAWDLDVGMRKEILDLLRKADPKDASGWAARISFDGRGTFGHTGKLIAAKKYDEAIAWLDKRLANPQLAPEQRAWLLAAKGNTYRRWGKNEAAHATLMQAHAAAPDSVMGKGARRLSLRFVGPPSIEFGWEGRHCRKEKTTWTIPVAHHLAGKGTHALAFQRTGGKGSLQILSLSVQNGKETLFRTADAQTLTAKSPRSAHTFRIGSHTGNPTLHVTWQAAAGTPSQGTIQLAPAKGKER
ncbi:MAG: hypothetical protein HN380_14615 [Victivallales bacterium]|jgi:hypothetical protein|nr:hypothetical protein [Victivallales bacterium]